MWTALIPILIEIFGPVLSELIKKLLDRWLKSAAGKLEREGVAASGTNGADFAKLLRTARDLLPATAVARRGLLNTLARYAPKADKDNSLTPAQLAKVKEACKGVR